MTTLPKAFLEWCSQPDQDSAIELISCGSDGWPHVAHLSVGELVVDSQGNIRTALWRASRSVGNLIDTGRACLLLTAVEGVFEIRTELVAHGTLPNHDELYAFLLRPVEVRDKSAPYARIVSGIRFELVDPVEAVDRWAAVRRSLLAHF